MKIEREELSSVVFGESVGEVTIGKTSMPLPYPALTQTDINYADAVIHSHGLDISHPHKLHESREWLWESDVKDLLHSKKLQQKKTDWINTQISKAKAASSAEVFVYTPYFGSSVPITRHLIEAFVDMQIKSEADVVNIVDSPSLTPSDMASVVKDAAKTALEHGKEPFYQIDMATAEALFYAKIQAVRDAIRGLTALYANPKLYFKNFGTLAKLRESPILRLLTNVNRRYPKTDSGGLLPVSLICADVVSPQLGLSFGNNKKLQEKVKAKEQTNARRMNADLFGYLTSVQHKRECGESLNCVCPIDKGNEMSDVVADFSGELYSAFRVHEPFAMFDAAEQVRHQIVSGNLRKFITKKKYAQRPADELFQINQTML